MGSDRTGSNRFFIHWSDSGFKIESNHRKIIALQSVKWKNTIELAVFKDINNLDDKFSSKDATLTIMYQEAREEMMRETVSLVTRISSLEAELKALNNSYYKLADDGASEKELRALEDSYYKLQDSIRQVEYDIKDIKAGGY